MAVVLLAQARSRAWSQVPCAIQWLQPEPTAGLIPFKRVLYLRDLAVAWSGKEQAAWHQRTKGRTSRTARTRKGMCLEDRPILEPNAAGIDIGSREIFVAVPPDRDPNPVRVFATFTENLQELAAWLSRCGVTTAAMESTGVYWIPLYDILEQHGIKPCLVNARQMKNVPGRRTDWHECQWLQFLHSV